MTVDAIVIGAGLAGLYGVHRAVSEGMTVLGIEAAPTAGGTWYWNRYPGARCDVESVDYSYSFDGDLQNEWTWSERFAAQPEILAYLEHVADRFDLWHHYLFDTEVVGARFDDAGGAWVVETSAPPRAGSYFVRLGVCRPSTGPTFAGSPTSRVRCTTGRRGPARTRNCAARRLV